MSISLIHWHYAVLLGYNLWMPDQIAPLNPPTRLLCGPGPSNVHPKVLEAMQAPMLGHLDPNFHETLDQLVELLKLAYQRQDGLTLALSATGTSGMEAGLASLTEPGDTVIVAVAGFFGARIVEIARRHGAHVVEVAVELGQAVPNEMILEALERHPETGLVAVVHAETSTGVRHPVAELAEAMRGSTALLMADCVTSLGGIELDAGGWGLDYCYSCSQKCLGAPPGLSPVSLSERALERIARRSTPDAVQLRLRSAAQILDRPPGGLPPHDADPAVLRALRGAAAGVGGGAREALAATRRRRRAPADGASGTWLRPAGRSRSTSYRS